MSAKALNPNQCDLLHLYYPVSECCLCKARSEIEELKERIRLLGGKPLEEVSEAPESTREGIKD